MRVLMPLPSTDVDPTESGVPFRFLIDAGHDVVFATPDGKPGSADPRMLTGDDLGWARPFLVARPDAIAAYREMETHDAFSAPIAYTDLGGQDFDAVVLPGGHAQGMKPYLESVEVAQCAARHLLSGRIVAAICHGVLVMARATVPDTGEPLLRGRQTTGLTRRMELSAWRVTKRKLGDYYRTYPETVEEEVLAAIGDSGSFARGHGGLRGFFEKILPLRDSPTRMARGFIVRDENYLSARWPGDVHAFSAALLEMLAEAKGTAAETADAARAAT